MKDSRSYGLPTDHSSFLLLQEYGCKAVVSRAALLKCPVPPMPQLASHPAPEPVIWRPSDVDAAIKAVVDLALEFAKYRHRQGRKVPMHGDRK